VSFFLKLVRNISKNLNRNKWSCHVENYNVVSSMTRTSISIILDLVDLGNSRIQSKVLDGISLTAGINLSDISILPTMTAGTGTCDFLLGNRGLHSYNGNPGPKRKGSPIPGTSR